MGDTTLTKTKVNRDLQEKVCQKTWHHLSSTDDTKDDGEVLTPFSLPKPSTGKDKVEQEQETTKSDSILENKVIVIKPSEPNSNVLESKDKEKETSGGHRSGKDKEKETSGGHRSGN